MWEQKNERAASEEHNNGDKKSDIANDKEAEVWFV